MGELLRKQGSEALDRAPAGDLLISTNEQGADPEKKLKENQYFPRSGQEMAGKTVAISS